MLLIFVFFAGCSDQNTEQDALGYAANILKTEAVTYSGVLGQSASLPINYNLEALDVELKAPSYELPLQRDEISNYETFSTRIPLDASALEMLGKNGFVVIENPYNPEEEDITSMYVTLKEEEIPVFITTDSLLHLYHIQFDETLRQIEENEFYDTLWETDLALLEASVKEYNSASGEEKEAARRNAAYFAVALSLLQPKFAQVQAADDPYGFVDEALFPVNSVEKYQFEVPSYVKEEVEAELALIEAHEGFVSSPIFLYEEDYSQYIPRGHYTRSEKLQNYFKAFMWHGRVSMLLKGELIKSEDPAKDARIQTIQASLISSKLENSPSLLENWDKIYGITAFYVGFFDDLGPYEYMEVMDQVFGNGEREFNETAIEELKTALAEYQGPKIYGGTGNCVLQPPFTPEQADQCLENTTGFRFMGQRFIPDSYVFSNLVGAYTGEYQGEKEEPFTFVISGAGRPIRGFPRGLDIMALLGSERAVFWLDELNDSSYENYSVQYANIETEFSNFSAADWNRNLYWSWLYSLQPLLKDYGEGYPTFMQTDAWQDKELSTSLASWTELRHDTILYAKQSYTITETSMPMPPEEKPVVGYVEPVPDFYARLLALTKMTNHGLDEMDVLDSGSKSRLTELEGILSRLQAISEKELENEELTEEDYEFIKNFGDQLEGVITDVDEKARKTTVVADVHTDGNTEVVLEEGVGYVDMLVVAYKLPDGRILLGAGPVMSYYEFKQPMEERLTDEKWREMLKENPPERPEWSSSYIS
ncbi:dTDP-D-glucose 4,6-dehydratase [Methanosarcina horonobensis HB-1 = JCM 15518]|uniref:dTDP-D-glucose 4,6-dehydratase n=2 Tax=Methanosarcina horonobensis TaxID=418008 RepID=A0A0E3SDC0_9EURY|nr:dTDP-D-glucose 4,6-dehydratase [Methanosarcina horonobensis HB-1 = JCM 15518]